MIPFAWPPVSSKGRCIRAAKRIIVIDVAAALTRNATGCGYLPTLQQAVFSIGLTLTIVYGSTTLVYQDGALSWIGACVPTEQAYLAYSALPCTLAASLACGRAVRFRFGAGQFDLACSRAVIFGSGAGNSLSFRGRAPRVGLAGCARGEPDKPQGRHPP